ncbi:tricalbin [Exidia glandulosa HHB12029]|uniref:Tricalbin n=1 Tax=Exidia glandulosa HHB12029 TaxID=1314781 RepID=A0A165PSV4_EXIGL|nr:tricalbin [Exidia glandulosa HHB12029]
MASSIPKGYSMANGADSPAPLQNGNGNAKVHQFDPEATPQQKAAAAGQGRDELKPANGPLKRDFVAKEVAIDTGKGAQVAPTITIDDADAEPASAADQTSPVPGAYPTGPAAKIPDWYKVGWRAVAQLDKDVPEGEERDRSILDAYIGEAYYGEWWHNAAIICVAVVFTHFLTLFRMGWGWIIIVLAFCSTYYTTSIARVRARARSDIQRELVKMRLSSPGDFETADWMNNFLDRFWLIYEPILSATIVSSVDQVLSASTPAFLDSIRLSTFTLGTRAPRIDRVHTFPRTEDDIVMMDWGFSFTPNDVSDLTPRQAASRVNPKIVLAIRVGKGLATAAMPILLEDLAFSGLMRIKMKLMTSFPHVQVVDLSFMEKPVFDYVLKPLGGETFGFDIGNIPGLSSFIRETVHSVLGPMMYDPNVFTLNLEQMLSGAPIDAAIGVVQVYVRNASGLKGSKIGGGAPDPYVSLSINKRKEMAKTKHRPNSTNPTWNEVKFILVQNLTEPLTFTVMDYNDHRKDTEMGVAQFELAQLNEDATREGVSMKIMKEGKERGDLLCDVSYFPVLKPIAVDGKEEPLPETKSGIVRLVIHQAKDLDTTKSMSGDLNPFAKVFLGAAGSSPIHATPRFKHTNSPVWESATEFLCADRTASVITVDVIDDRDFLKDPVVGHISVKLNDLLHAKEEGQGRDWWPLTHCKSGKLRMSAEWKPLNMAGSLSGADQYAPPIGIIRLWVKKATDVKNVEAGLGGKSDPYLRVLINNVTKARTEVVNNNLSPEWDTILYVPVHHLKEILILEAMDYQHLTKDRSLGIVELRVQDLAQESGDIKYPYSSTGKQEQSAPIKVEGGAFKGALHFSAEFVPAMHLKGVKFQSHGNELENAVARADEEGSDNGSESGKRAVTPPQITASHAVGEEDNASVPTSPTSATGTVDTGKDKATKPAEDEGIELSVDELFEHQSGVVVFDVISGQLPKKSRLEILLDDGYWPAFGTTKARSNNAKWDQVGEGFIKELDFGKIWLRLNENDEGEKEDIIAQFKFDAKPFLQTCLTGESTFTLKDNEARDVASVVIAAKYIPVDFKLEPRESVNNQGVLRVTLVEGKEIHGADRSGKSDPFVVFSLGDQKVYKSEVIKKTLAPQWKESFEVMIPSRVAGGLTMEIFDWNQFEGSKSLGTADIPLDDLEPFIGVDRTYQLNHAKHGEKGEIRLQLLFQPEIIAKQRKATSAVGSAGRAMTQVGGFPGAAGKGVVQGIGGVAKGAKGVFKRGDHTPKSSLDVPAFDLTPATPTNASAGQASFPVGSGANAFPTTGDPGAGPYMESGVLRVSVRSAKDLSQDEDVKPYAVLKVGGKEQKTKHSKGPSVDWEESFTFNAGPDTKTLNIGVFDYSRFGKDKLLGDADVEIWRHLTPSSGVASADVSVELTEGQGLVQLRLEFEKGGSVARSASSASFDYGSPSRFSIRKRPSNMPSDADSHKS